MKRGTYRSRATGSRAGDGETIVCGLYHAVPNFAQSLIVVALVMRTSNDRRTSPAGVSRTDADGKPVRALLMVPADDGQVVAVSTPYALRLRPVAAQADGIPSVGAVPPDADGQR